MINGISASGMSQADIEQLSTSERRRLIHSGQIECETCANRKYKDGSDEMVSYKNATHISPEAAGAAVRAHEQEHVSNAYNKANKAGDAKVIQASVSIKTSICPECGRTYVSGGETTTQIKYNDDSYAQNTKQQDNACIPGSNIDAPV